MAPCSDVKIQASPSKKTVRFDDAVVFFGKGSVGGGSAGNNGRDASPMRRTRRYTDRGGQRPSRPVQGGNPFDDEPVAKRPMPFVFNPWNNAARVALNPLPDFQRLQVAVQAATAAAAAAAGVAENAEAAKIEAAMLASAGNA